MAETERAGLAVRQAAAKLLAAVVEKQTSLDGLLDKAHGAPAARALAEQDRALLRALLLAALRHRCQIAARLNALLQKPLPAGAKALAHILHIGAAQILFFDIPPHAAVDLAVECAKRNPQARRFAPLVNAVLRALARQKQSGAFADSDSALDTAPAWFAQMLERDYGAEKAAAILRAQAEPVGLDIAVRADAAHWAAELGGRVMPFGTVRLSAEKVNVSDLPGFAEGAWWVQNAAANLPARLLGGLAGKRAADLCAAPGGKTAQLALAGAEVTAVDISAARLRRLEENMRRLRFSVRAEKADLRALAGKAGFQLFDAVLLDAPCSSTGTIRRHPDILWTKSAKDIAALAALQAELLAASLALVRRGGVILFCNCSLAKAEGEHMLAEFLRAQAGQVKLLPFRAAEAEALLTPEAAADSAVRAQAAELITGDGFLRVTPADMGGMDGFFAARLQKL